MAGNASGTAAAEPCLGGVADREEVRLETFHIDAKPDRKSYAMGETVRFHATLSRPAHKDPAGLGLEYDPPHSEPAADIYLGVVVQMSGAFLVGFGVSDQNGKVEVPVKLRPTTKPGEVTVIFYAWKETLRAPCMTVREFGIRTYDRLFTVGDPRS